MLNIETPAVIIDMEQVERNLRRYQQCADLHGCALRPHTKTHKMVRLAKMQMEFGAKGVCCAKLSEAEVMAAGGIDDIFVAYPVIGREKIERFLALSRQIRIICGVDSIEGASALSDAAAAHGQRAEVRIELDTGYARAGVQRDEILEFAKRVSEMPGLDLGGIFTFKSATLAGKPTLDLRAAAEEEGRLLSETAELLRSNGIPIRDVSGGSTPTGELVAAYPGITEIRPGTYIFQDVSELRQGVAAPEECCAVVKVTVVSTPTPYRAVIDGGSKVFAADKKPMTPPVNLPGFGRIVGHDELIFDHMNEEHGVIVRNDAPTGLKVGDVLYIVPNHVCTTMNLFDFVYLREKDGSYTRTRVDGRGRVW